MYLTVPVLSVLTLAFALPHDEPSPTAPVVIETIYVTITHTIDGHSSPASSAPSSIVAMSLTSCTHFSHIHTGLPSTQGCTVALYPYTASSRSEALSDTSDLTTTIPDTVAHDPVGWGGVDDALFTSSSVSLIPTKAVNNEEDDTYGSHTVYSSATSRPTTMSTIFHDPIGWGGVDDALFTSVSIPGSQIQPGDAASTTQVWPRRSFFVGAMAMPKVPSSSAVEGSERLEAECISCPKGRDLVCINTTHFGYCDEGCVEPRKIKDGMKCVDGRMYGNRNR